MEFPDLIDELLWGNKSLTSCLKLRQVHGIIFPKSYSFLCTGSHLTSLHNFGSFRLPELQRKQPNQTQHALTGCYGRSHGYVATCCIFKTLTCLSNLVIYLWQLRCVDVFHPEQKLTIADVNMSTKESDTQKITVIAAREKGKFKLRLKLW